VRELGSAGFRLEDLPRPRPGAGEVLIGVRRVGINQLDLNVIAGVGPGLQARLPRVLGIDPSGIIEELGSGVPAELLGARVVVKPNIACGDCQYCRDGHDGDCPKQTVVGVHRDGGAAEYVCVPHTNVIVIGDLDFSTATAAIHSVPIALHMINAAGNIRAGRTVLVTGAGGALGSVAVQLARNAGARVIAAVRREDVDLPNGVEKVVHTTADQLLDQVRAIAPDGVDTTVDATGVGSIATVGVRALGWGGRFVFCAASVDPDITVDLRSLYLGRRSIVGTASASRAEAREAIEFVRNGAVVPLIEHHIFLDEAIDAYRSFGQRARGGKVIIHVAD
jgi:D-arabinose 1-dehydrogenase-like Zn-dependent alcohol dehydrogenase